LLLTASAYAADVSVDCNKKKTITAALAVLSKQGPNTIHVSGACNETVIIDDYEDLTLIANPSASINDPTPSNPSDNDVVGIFQSRNITLRGFTINGGAVGVACYQFSVCYLRDLIIQGQSDTGVVYSRSGGFVDNTTIQNTLLGGLALSSQSEVLFGSGVFGTPGTATIQDIGTEANGSLPVWVLNGSELTLGGATVQNNAYGDGAYVAFGSVLRMINSTITGNGGNGIKADSSVVRFQLESVPVSITNNGSAGIRLQNTSTVQSQGSGTLTISGNAGNGISIGHLSFVRLGGGRTITGNGSPDVNCSVSTARSDGVGDSGSPNLGGGTTNCTEPAP
jgi:hypothetical protein